MEYIKTVPSQKIVKYDEHIDWLTGVLKSDDTLAYIIENSKNTAIGHIRFKRNLDLSCTLTVYLFPDETGKGLGVKAIKCGCNCVYISIFKVFV